MTQEKRERQRQFNLDLLRHACEQVVAGLLEKPSKATIRHYALRMEMGALKALVGDDTIDPGIVSKEELAEVAAHQK